MAYTALQLITRAYYLSQVVSRGLQTVSGEQVTDGEYLLNALLDVKASDLHLIPYFQEYDFNTVAGTESYFVPNLVYADSVTFNIGVVRYSMIDMTRKGYFSTPRVDNVQSLPFSYRVERKLDGSQIYLYFVPADIYAIKIWGKFGLTDVTLTTDLSLTYDKFYIEYLRYALAEYICAEYGATFPDESKAKYMEIRKKLMMISPADLSIQKRTYFSRQPALDWQLINLPGWVPF
jgi:hypothetical protein